MTAAPPRGSSIVFAQAAEGGQKLNYRKKHRSTT
jgi:hypothetical protein